MSRCEIQVRIANELGLHLRAAAAFAKVAERFTSDISVLRDTVKANGKSIISLVTLTAPRGTLVKIVAEGDDSDRAVAALAELVEHRFGEAS